MLSRITEGKVTEQVGNRLFSLWLQASGVRANPAGSSRALARLDRGTLLAVRAVTNNW